jgi:hypothetical protein
MNTAGPKSAGKCNRRFVKHAEGSMCFTTTAQSTIRALIAGVELRLANGITLLAKFDSEFASHSSTYAGTGTFRYRW